MVARSGDPYRIRDATPEDVPAIVGLLRLCLGEAGVPRTEEFWRWKHESNPFGPSPVLLAEADGQLVGVRAFLRWRWRCGDRVVKAVRAVDTATHPDWRGRGIFRRLTLELVERMRQEGVAFVFNTPNAKSGAGYLSMGWKTVGRLRVSVRPRKPLRFVARLLNMREAVALPSCREGGHLSVYLRGSNGPRETLGAHGSLQRYEADGSPDYLSWRYLDIPGVEYVSRTAQCGLAEGSGTESIVVFRIRRRRALTEALVEDLVDGGPSSRSGPQTVPGAIVANLLEEADADYAAMLGPPDRVGRALGRFHVRVPGPSLMVRPLGVDSDLPDPGRLTSWAPSAGAMELF